MLKAFRRCRHMAGRVVGRPPAPGGFSNERQGRELESHEDMNLVGLMSYLQTHCSANSHRARSEAADRESVAMMDYRMVMSILLLTEELNVRNGRLKEAHLHSCSRAGSSVCYLDVMRCLGWCRLVSAGVEAKEASGQASALMRILPRPVQDLLAYISTIEPEMKPSLSLHADVVAEAMSDFLAIFKLHSKSNALRPTSLKDGSVCARAAGSPLEYDNAISFASSSVSPCRGIRDEICRRWLLISGR
jgi:hypothetical protein